MHERVRVEIYENYFKTNKFSDTAEEVPKSLPRQRYTGVCPNSLPRQRKCPNPCRGREIRACALIWCELFSPGPCYGPGLKGLPLLRAAAPTWRASSPVPLQDRD